MSLIGATNEEKIWNYLKSKIKNDYGVAGCMGNLYAESGLNHKNLENVGNIALGTNDEEYTCAVDNGKYTNFVYDQYGYGLAQWTYFSRKKNLLAFAKSCNVSIGDLKMQLDFLIKELSENYKSVLETLKNAKSILEASNAMLLKYECPADQSVAAQNKRASYGLNYYEKYANEVKPMSFKMRTTKPEAGNKYYITKASGGWSNAIKGNPTDKDCDVLSNCVGYAVGRFNEIGGYGYCKYLSPVNAENFIQYKGSLQVGQTPKLGACMVWQKGSTLNGSDGAGHVAIVEKIISSTEVYTSESGWGWTTPFKNVTRKKGSGNWEAGDGYKFLGFIYNPAVQDNSEQPQQKPVQSTTTTQSKPATTHNIKNGDVVSISSNAVYYGGGAVPSWVRAKQWIIDGNPVGDRAVINKSVDGRNAICSPISTKYLTVVKSSSSSAKPTSTQNSNSATAQYTPEIGDIVNFNGNTHYSNAYAASGSKCASGKAKITAIHKPGQSKHPYHLVRVGGSGPYGWVDAGTFTKA